MADPIETNTNENNRVKFYAILIILLIAVFGVGFAAGEGRVKVSTTGKVEITKGNVISNTADYSLLWQALDLINSKFVDRPVDQQKLMYGAVQGLVSAAGDPYTAFFNPEDAKKFTEQLKGLFEGIEKPFSATRYHSLLVEKKKFPSALEITAWTKQDEIMSLRHKKHSTWGVQFHPESILTKSGKEILKNFLALSRKK